MKIRHFFYNKFKWFTILNRHPLKGGGTPLDGSPPWLDRAENKNRGSQGGTSKTLPKGITKKEHMAGRF